MFYQRICHLNMQYKKVYGIRAPAGSVSRVREILRVMNSSPMLDVELTLGKKKKKVYGIQVPKSTFQRNILQILL